MFQKVISCIPEKKKKKWDRYSSLTSHVKKFFQVAPYGKSSAHFFADFRVRTLRKFSTQWLTPGYKFSPSLLLQPTNPPYSSTLSYGSPQIVPLFSSREKKEDGNEIGERVMKREKSLLPLFITSITFSFFSLRKNYFFTLQRVLHFSRCVRIPRGFKIQFCHFFVCVCCGKTII